jgi:hypothetical protein
MGVDVVVKTPGDGKIEIDQKGLVYMFSNIFFSKRYQLPKKGR